MRYRTRLYFFFFLGVLVTLIVPAIILATGVFNMAATNAPGPVETALAGFALDRSMAWRAPKTKNPKRDDPAARAGGLDHYRENCVYCHGAPDVQTAELAKGLNPPPPDLAEPDAQELTDGELFWTIKNGIRMTGMPAFAPTHNDDEIWEIVTFVRHLPKLTNAEKATLSKVTGSEEEHHEEAAGMKAPAGEAHPAMTSHTMTKSGAGANVNTTGTAKTR